MAAKKKKNIRGKKGEAGGTPSEPTTVNITNRMDFPKEMKLKQGDPWFVKLVKAPFKSLGTILVILFIAAIIFFFFFNTSGRSLAVVAGVGLQDVAAKAVDVIRGAGAFFEDPSGTILDSTNPPVNVGSQQQGVIIALPTTEQTTYLPGQDAIMNAAVTVLPLETDEDGIQFVARCQIQDPSNNLGVKTSTLGDKDYTGKTPFDLIPDLGFQPIEGQVLTSPIGAPDYASTADYYLSKEQLQTTQRFTISCKFPGEITKGMVFEGKNTINAVFAEVILEYHTKTSSTLNVYTYYTQPEDQLKQQFKEQIQREGISAPNDKIKSKSLGGAMSLGLDLDVAQPITPGNNDYSIPLSVSLLNNKWQGKLQTLEGLAVTIPQPFTFNGNQCQNFEQTGTNARLKDDVVTKINECAAKDTRKDRDACMYNIEKLFFYCKVALPSDPGYYDTELGNAHTIQAAATYTYTISKLKDIRYKKPATEQ